MKIQINLACVGESDRVIYGVSFVDNSLYRMSKDDKLVSFICHLPDTNGKQWFTLNYCNHRLYLTLRSAEKIVEVDLNYNTAAFVEWDNEYDSSMGFFAHTYKNSVYFVHRNPAYIMKYDTKKKTVYKVFDEVSEWKRVENYSAYNQWLVLYNLTEKRCIVFDAENGKIVSEFVVGFKFRGFQNSSSEIYLFEEYYLDVLDFYGKIINRIKLPDSKTSADFYLIEYGENVAVYDKKSSLYSLRHNEKFVEEECVMKNVCSISNIPMRMFSKWSDKKGIDFLYYYYDSDCDKYVEGEFEISRNIDEKQYLEKLKASLSFVYEAPNVVCRLENFINLVTYFCGNNLEKEDFANEYRKNFM